MLTAIPQHSPALSFPGFTHQGAVCPEDRVPCLLSRCCCALSDILPPLPPPFPVGPPQAVNNAPHKFTFQAASLVRAGLGARRPIQPRNEFPWTPAASFET